MYYTHQRIKGTELGCLRTGTGSVIPHSGPLQLQTLPPLPSCSSVQDYQQIQEHSLGNSTKALCLERQKQGTGTSLPRSTLPRGGGTTFTSKAPLLSHFIHCGLPGSEKGPGEGQSSTLLLMPTEFTVTTRTNLRPGSLPEVG